MNMSKNYRPTSLLTSLAMLVLGIAAAAQTAPMNGPPGAGRAGQDRGPPGAAPLSPPGTPFPKGPGSLNGVWLNAEYKGTGQNPARSRSIRATDGQMPPLLPEAAATLEKRVAEADDKGNIYANTLSQCLPGGVPEMDFGASYPIQIIETPDQVTMLYEEQNHFRTLYINGTHPADPDPGYFGHSIGHWEGDTLVVDTVGLSDKTTLDMVGTPHSDSLHVIERFRRISFDQIELRVTIDDKGAFSKTWETRTTWRQTQPGTHVGEYICENNRNTSDANGFQSFGPPSHK